MICQETASTKMKRPGFSIIELLVVTAIIAVLIGLLLPNVRFSREAARRMACSNHFKLLGIAMHNYHAAYDQLPMAMGGTGIATDHLHGNSDRLNGLVALLPFLSEQALWEQISNGSEFDGVLYPPMGPAPWVETYEPWRTNVGVFRCPSDPSTMEVFAMSNYAFSVGDSARSLHNPSIARAPFACGLVIRFKDVLDGLSNTIAMTEIATRLDRSKMGQYAINQPPSMLDAPSQVKSLMDQARPSFYQQSVSLSEHGRGTRWADGAAGFGLVNTILPPNSPSVAVEGIEAVDGIYSATSHHQGGTHVLTGDGAVKFITDSIDSGDGSQPTLTQEQIIGEMPESPYGLWGALGTAAAREPMDEEL